MATRRESNDEVDKLVTVEAGGKARKVRAGGADRLCEQAETAEASEGAMGHAGRR
jgi:hypothetical protein